MITIGRTEILLLASAADQPALLKCLMISLMNIPAPLLVLVDSVNGDACHSEKGRDDSRDASKV